MTDQHGIAEGHDERERHVAAEPDAEDDNSPVAETSSTLTYLGFGIPLIILIATGIFAIVNDYPFLVYLCFGVAAVLIVIAILVIVRLVRANRHRSRH